MEESMRIKVHKWVGVRKQRHLCATPRWLDFIFQALEILPKVMVKDVSSKKTALAAERDWNGDYAECWYCHESPSWSRTGGDLEKLNTAQAERRQVADVSWDRIWHRSCAGVRESSQRWTDGFKLRHPGVWGQLERDKFAQSVLETGISGGEPENQVSFHFLMTPQGIFVGSSTLTIRLTSH